MQIQAKVYAHGRLRKLLVTITVKREQLIAGGDITFVGRQHGTFTKVRGLDVEIQVSPTDYDELVVSGCETVF